MVAAMSGTPIEMWVRPGSLIALVRLVGRGQLALVGEAEEPFVEPPAAVEVGDRQPDPAERGYGLPHQGRP
jgi:hypothetical protein